MWGVNRQGFPLHRCPTCVWRTQPRPHTAPPDTWRSRATASSTAQPSAADAEALVSDLASRLDMSALRQSATLHRGIEPADVPAVVDDASAKATGTAGVRVRRGDRESLTDTAIELLPKVAIVGRPNVGKSALFNRICGSNSAIIYDYPGVTRDRLYMRADWGSTEFVVVDTGGLMSGSENLPANLAVKDVRGLGDSSLPQAIEAQAAAGIEEAHAVVLVVDGQCGLVPADADIVAWLRKAHPSKPLLLAVNKCESTRTGELQAAEFWGLGLEPIPVSAISGTGTGDLMDALISKLPPPRQPRKASSVPVCDRAPIAVAILGRPNVGKSSLLNTLVGQERSIVSATAGTTRDAIDTDFTAPDGGKFRLVDTAGIRKRGAVSSSADGAEVLSVHRAIRAVRRCEVVALVLDGVRCAGDGRRFIVPSQDYQLAELIAGEGRAAVIVVNKWDAVAKNTHTLAEYEKELLAQLRPLAWAPVVFTSAFSGQRVTQILSAVESAAEQHRRRISTATLNLVVQEAVSWRPPPAVKGSRRRGRIYYATQTGVQPPTFVMFVNDVKLFEDEYKRYLERQLRENAGFAGSPIRILWRGKPAAAKPGAKQLDKE